MRREDRAFGVALLGLGLLLFGMNVCYAKLNQILDMLSTSEYYANLYRNFNLPLLIGACVSLIASLACFLRGLRK